jgi:hypothetical protein
MRQTPAPQHQENPAPAAEGNIRFTTLLYRFIFFDWLFADMNKAMDLFERHSAWQHNRQMSRYLPTYLWRWSVLTVLAFGLGCLFEQAFGTTVLAAWFFTWSCVTLTGMLVISVLWVFLSNSERS